MRTLLDELAALVILAGAVGIVLAAYDWPEDELVLGGGWQAGRPWHWPAEPLAPLEASWLVCMTKVEGSPERVC